MRRSDWSRKRSWVQQIRDGQISCPKCTPSNQYATCLKSICSVGASDPVCLYCYSQYTACYDTKIAPLDMASMGVASEPFTCHPNVGTLTSSTATVDAALRAFLSCLSFCVSLVMTRKQASEVLIWRECSLFFARRQLHTNSNTHIRTCGRAVHLKNC